MLAGLGIFAGGVLFGTAGVKLLSSKEAKKCYTHITAAVLRARDSVLKTATSVRENCGDIVSDAKAINEKKAAAKAAEEDRVIEDAAVLPDEAEA